VIVTHFFIKYFFDSGKFVIFFNTLLNIKIILFEFLIKMSKYILIFPDILTPPETA
jgi:hypothetical protein